MNEQRRCGIHGDSTTSGRCASCDSELECLDGPWRCQGPVTYWHSGGTYGKSWPRCELHGKERLKRYENSIERYADSDVVPDWFDPTYAGESWNEE